MLLFEDTRLVSTDVIRMSNVHVNGVYFEIFSRMTHQEYKIKETTKKKEEKKKRNVQKITPAIVQKKDCFLAIAVIVVAKVVSSSSSSSSLKICELLIIVTGASPE